jgi:hypothetical protein
MTHQVSLDTAPESDARLVFGIRNVFAVGIDMDGSEHVQFMLVHLERIAAQLRAGKIV